MKHSTEPWEIGGVYYGKVVILNEKRIVANVNMTYKDFEEEEQANAKRIVECVNACAGMEDPIKEVAKMKRLIRALVSKVDKEMLTQSMDYNLKKLEETR